MDSYGQWFPSGSWAWRVEQRPPAASSGEVNSEAVRTGVLPELRGIQPFARSPSTCQPARLVPTAFLPLLGFAGLCSNDASEHVWRHLITSSKSQVSRWPRLLTLRPANPTHRLRISASLRRSHPYAAGCTI